MKSFKWSLKTLLAAVLVAAGSMAVLTHPTPDAAFATGVVVSLMLLAAAAIALGGGGARRSASVAFVVVCGSVLYLNDPNRQTLGLLPSFNTEMAEWLDQRFGWTQWKGPPRTFVYWSSGGRVAYVSFDADGNYRSDGWVPRWQVERELRKQIDVDNLPSECTVPQPTPASLARIVGLLAAVLLGLAAARLATAAQGTSEAR